MFQPMLIQIALFMSIITSSVYSKHVKEERIVRSFRALSHNEANIYLSAPSATNKIGLHLYFKGEAFNKVFVS